MNAMVRSSEVSGYYKQINGATAFKKKMDNKKKEKENKNLKDENKRHQKKTQAQDVEIEKSQTIEAEAEAYVAIVANDECDKEIERDKHKKSVKRLRIKYD